MVRSLYSGVSGMKAHQSRMDVIGNNISNVNTYGFKASRVSFSDVFYQSTNSASAPSANSGGVNPSEIGYGAILGSVDVLHGTSTMASTTNALDVAITGEGFFQVQDSEGNTYYTRAGLLNIDSYGNLVDVNGNFVLGYSGSPVGQPADDNRIQLSIPNVTASTAEGNESINGIGYTVESSNLTRDANLTMTLIEGYDLPIGQPVAAVITSGGISVSVNPNTTFETLADLNDAINSAITAAYGGTHPGGTYTISMDDDSAWPVEGLTGAEILGNNYGVKLGSVDVPSGWANLNFGDCTVGTSFGQLFAEDADLTSQWQVERLYEANSDLGEDEEPDEDDEDIFMVTCTIDGKTYSGLASASELDNNSVGWALYAGDWALTGDDAGSVNSYTFTSNTETDDNDYIIVEHPKSSKLTTFFNEETTDDVSELADGKSDVVASAASNDIGLGGVPIILSGGTEGGAQTVADLTGIAIGGDGVIYGNHSVFGLMELGRIDLVTFDNPSGLTQIGSTYFQVTANSGSAELARPGEDGTGAIASATLEMSSVDLSGEMADMITTQRGFQANSRMITVSDTMLEELINLKR